MEYNQDLFKAHYGNNPANEKEDESYNEEGEEELNSYFWEKLAYRTLFFKPLKYDEEIAFKCELIPFKYVGEDETLELLAIGSSGMDLNPRLEAYQALTDGTIDESSKLFSCSGLISKTCWLAFIGNK